MKDTIIITGLIISGILFLLLIAVQIKYRVDMWIYRDEEDGIK